VQEGLKHKYRYAYYLEGVDKDWVQPEAGDQVAGYTGLDGGSYVFRLKVAIGAGLSAIRFLSLLAKEKESNPVKAVGGTALIENHNGLKVTLKTGIAAG